MKRISMLVPLSLVLAIAGCGGSPGPGGPPPGRPGNPPGTPPTPPGTPPTPPGNPPPPGGGAQCQRAPLAQPRWRDLGEVAHASAQAVLALGSDVLVATSSGLYRRPFDGSSAWQPAGLSGKMVRALYAAKSTPGLLLAGLGNNPTAPTESPLWRSLDGGATWQPVGEALKDSFASQPGAPVYDGVESFASYVEPGREVFFANASGASLVRSTNGKDWMYVAGGPGQVCYACEIAAPPGLGAFVYQGCECPLDSASIARIGVDDLMGKPENVVDLGFLGNRRPNILTSTPAAPGALLAGVEGGLVRLTAAGPSWIYQSNSGDDPNTHGYAYIRAVFIDPCVSGHVSFGGTLNAANPILQFYESTDDGAHSTRQDAPGSLRFSDIDVVGGAPSSDGRALILAATLDHAAAHVLVREY